MTTLDLTKPLPALTEDNYLTHSRGILSWLFTLDHKRIGVNYLDLRADVLLLRRHVRAAAANGTAHAGQDRSLKQDAVQPGVHAARRDHGVPGDHPVGARSAGQFRPADHAGRQGRRVPATEPDELVAVGGLARSSSSARCSVAVSTRAGRSTLRTRSTKTRRWAGRFRPLWACSSSASVLDLHRPELHRHDSPPAARRA